MWAEVEPKHLAGRPERMKTQILHGLAARTVETGSAAEASARSRFAS
jgi:predicted alpha/beta-hydrolase family hydrolase